MGARLRLSALLIRAKVLETILDQVEAESSKAAVSTAYQAAGSVGYLLYCFERSDVVECEAFFAPDDRSAIQASSRRRAGRAAKLWAGSRKVHTFDEAPDRLQLTSFLPIGA